MNQNGKEYHNKVELYKFPNKTYHDGYYINSDSYPFTSSISGAPILHHNGDFYLFGGRSVIRRYSKVRKRVYYEYHEWATIAKFQFSETKRSKWSIVGQLKKPRSNHNAIWTGSSFLVVGGDGKNLVEVCNFDKRFIDCERQRPKLSWLGSFPKLFVVDEPYCNSTVVQKLACNSEPYC